MTDTHSGCGSCGKGVHSEQVKRCSRCNRKVCKWCMCDEHTCDDCFFSSLQANIVREQFAEELNKLGLDRHVEAPRKKT